LGGGGGGDWQQEKKAMGWGLGVTHTQCDSKQRGGHEKPVRNIEEKHRKKSFQQKKKKKPSKTGMTRRP